MTNRFARLYQKLHARLGGRRKLALAVVGLWIAAELAAAATVAIAGKGWLESDPAPASAKGGSAPTFGFASRAGPSLAVL